MKYLRWMVRAPHLLLSIAATLLSLPAEASATWIFVDVATNLCLDSNGTSIYTHVCNGGDYQNWTLQDDGVIKHTKTGICLDSSSTNVYPHSCNGGDFQKWRLFGQTLRNKATGNNLDSNASGAVYAQPPNGGNFQNWAGRVPGPSSGCGAFQVRNTSTNTCQPAGYGCPVNGHWDSAVRGTGGCVCDVGYNWDGSRCAVTQAVASNTPAPQPAPQPVLNGQDPTAITNQGYATDFYGVKLYRDRTSGQIAVGSDQNGGLPEGYYNLFEFMNNNDAVTSLQVSRGYKVQLFADKDFKGKSWVYDSNTSYVGQDANDKTSSFRVFRDLSGKVKLYSDASRQGYSQEFTLRDYDDLGASLNGKVSSMEIPSGWKVVLYERSNFEGGYRIYDSGSNYVGDDFNDKAASMRIIDDTPIGNWGSTKRRCVYSGEGQEYIEYEARLWDLPNGTSWEEACAAKGAWWDNQWRRRPTYCVKDNNSGAIYSALSALGVFFPFVPIAESAAIGATKVASLAAGLGSASLSTVKDNVGRYATGSLSTGIWGRFLIQDDSQCNVLHNMQYKQCLSSDNNFGENAWNPGGTVSMMSCDGNDARTLFLRRGERFELAKTSGFSNTETLVNGYCLEDDDPGSYVHSRTCNGSSAQNWELLDGIDGAAAYKNRATGRCLQPLDGLNIITQPCDVANRNQNWR